MTGHYVQVGWLYREMHRIWPRDQPRGWKDYVFIPMADERALAFYQMERADEPNAREIVPCFRSDR